MSIWSRIFAAMISAFLAALAVTNPVHGEADAAAKVTLLPGWRLADGSHMAAVRITLAEGWKTYWRAPGDAGIPPRLSWRSDTSITGADIIWPRPDIIDVGGMVTFGYSGEVILPVRLSTGAGVGEDFTTDLSIDLGVCKDICVPIRASVFATHSAASTEDAEILASLALATPPYPLIATCSVKPIEDGLAISVDIPVNPSTAWEFAAIEYEDKTVWVSQVDVSRNDSTLTLSADLVPPEASPFALQRSGLLFTIFAGETAAEIAGCVTG